MPLFRVSTGIELNRGDRDDLINKASERIAQIIKKDVKYVTITFDDKSTDRDDKSTDPHITTCYVTYFDEYNQKLEKTLVRAAKKLGDLLMKKAAKAIGDLSVQCPLNREQFKIRICDYRNRVLVDWTKKNSVIATTPIESQGSRKCCWAYAHARATSFNYAIDNPSITDPRKILTSQQELADWVYSYVGLGKEKDKNGNCIKKIETNGTYGLKPANAFQYVQAEGISLLENYELEPDNKERSIETTYNETVFNDMVRSRGERIFIKRYNQIKGDKKNPDKKRIFSIEFLTQILHKGVVQASLFFCNDQECELCPGFRSHKGDKGDTVYDEVPHPLEHNYSHHAVVVVGVGNEDGKDYLKIRNTWGLKWGKEGYAKVHIKFFRQVFQVLGTEKKQWTNTNGEEWTLTATT